MLNNLLTLVDDIMKGNNKGLASNDQFRTTILSPLHFNDCLKSINISDNYLFVYCNNMINLIQTGKIV